LPESLRLNRLSKDTARCGSRASIFGWGAKFFKAVKENAQKIERRPLHVVENSSSGSWIPDEFPDNSLLLNEICGFRAEFNDFESESENFPVNFPVLCSDG
jgi:hypothetical protein